MNKEPEYKPTVEELAKGPEDAYGWEWRYAADLEREYLRSLKNPKDVLDYRDQRLGEVFLDNL